MNEHKKYEYFKFLFRKANTDLLQYEISYSDKQLINNLFNKLSNSENLLKELYILSHVKEMKNIGRYFIFILKKIEDNVINFDNFTHNINTDSNYIENELLKYFSNPELRKISDYKISERNEENSENPEEISVSGDEYGENKEETGYYRSDEKIKDINNEDTTDLFENESENESEDDEEITEFRKNYLELIQTGETDEEIVFELPKMDKGGIENTAMEFGSEEKEESLFKKSVENLFTEKESAEFESAFDLPKGTDGIENKEENTNEEISAEVLNEIKVDSLKEEIKNEDEKNDEIEIKPAAGSDIIKPEVESSFIIKGKIISKEVIKAEEDKDEKNKNEIIIESKENIETAESIKANEAADRTEKENTEADETVKHIKLSEDIQEELNLFEKDPEKYEEETEAATEEEEEDKLLSEIEKEEPEPANAVFVEYEDDVKSNNDELSNELDIMIYLVNANISDEEQRNSNIKSIIEKSTYLENISREMSLEIISNIYQTITISFEKISDGKYDLSEGTLNLFKKGLSLVNSLIKGDDYFGYKDILKSIENIRNSLIEEKEKRELYERQQKEKQEIEKQINQRYPEDSQKIKIKQLKQLIRELEINLNSLDKISGEYQIYEALRSLSVNLNSLKDIVILSKELNLKKMGQLSEASYIFIKFLQNYRINPVSTETKEIFGYIIYNMKSIILNKQTEDIDIFISYLNDPVKIFSKKNKKRT